MLYSFWIKCKICCVLLILIESLFPFNNLVILVRGDDEGFKALQVIRLKLKGKRGCGEEDKEQKHVQHHFIDTHAMETAITGKVELKLRCCFKFVGIILQLQLFNVLMLDMSFFVPTFNQKDITSVHRNNYYLHGLV